MLVTVYNEDNGKVIIEVEGKKYPFLEKTKQYVADMLCVASTVEYWKEHFSYYTDKEWEEIEPDTEIESTYYLMVGKKIDGEVGVIEVEPS